MSTAGSKVTTRNSARSTSDTSEPASLQSLDDKLNAVIGMLETNTQQINSVRSEQRDICNSLELCHASINDLKLLVHNQDSKIVKCESDIERIGNQNVTVQNKLKSLERDMNFLEQYSHRNNLIIYGIPEQTNENIHTVIRRLAVAIQFEDWSLNYVDAVHRIGAKSGSRPRPIIIKFTSRLVKEEFLKKRKVRRNLKAMDLGYSSEDSIYINESLTSSTRHLLKQTREAAKAKNYNQVWTMNCSIFVRKDSKGNWPAIRINSPQDLEGL